MAQPPAFVPSYSFTAFQTAQPAQPLPGDQLDLQLLLAKQTLDAILNNLALIQRDDLALANNTVGYDQLKTEVSFGLNPAVVWEAGHQFYANDGAWINGKLYRCIEEHVSSAVFADDLADGVWQDDPIVDFADGGGTVGLNESAAATTYYAIATEGQTEFGGVDENGNTIEYVPGVLEVYVDGLRINPVDFTATNGTSVVFDTALTAGQEVLISAFSSVVIAQVGTSGIENGAVTYAKMQDISATSRLLGRYSSGSGDPQEIALGTGLTVTGGTLESETFFTVAATDQSTPLTTGSNKRTFYFPFGVTLTGIAASLRTASSSGTVTVDVNVSGTTIMSSAKLVIDEGEVTTSTAATPPVLTTSAIAAWAPVTIDIDGSGSGAYGLDVHFVYKRT